jgi:hypothetical protein
MDSSIWRHPWTLVILVVALCLVALLILSAEDTSSLPMHSMEVTLFPPELEAKVTADQPGAVTFGGNVTIDKQQGVERVTVTLTAETANGWPTVLSEHTMVFINPETRRFQLTVIVPEGAPVSSTTATVHAHAESPIWSDDQSVMVTVTVQQFFKMGAWMEQSTFESEPGERVMGKLFVNNSGNGEDTLAVSVAELPKGITKVIFDEEQLAIPYGFEGDFAFTIHVDKDLEVGQDGTMLTIVLKVTSLEAKARGLAYAKTYPMYVYCPGWETKLKEDWPTYVGYGVGVTVVIIPVALVIRWRRRKTWAELEHVEGMNGD